MHLKFVPSVGLSICLAFALSSCGLLGKEFTLKKTVKIDVSENDDVCGVDKLTFALGEDEAYAQVKDNIGKVELRKVVVRVVNPKTNEASLATKANGKLEISATEDGPRLVLGTYEDLALAEDSSQEIPYQQDAADALAQAALNAPNTFYVDAEGCVDAKPGNFEVALELTLYAELKAQ